MTKASRIYSKFSKEYGWEKLVEDYLLLLDKNINPNSIILDAGSGEGGMFAKSKLNKKGKRKLLMGIDLSIKRNPYLDKRFVGNLERLPFDDETFDIILCEWVTEHLKNPYLVFEEFSHVLKKNGVLVIITVNILNPLVLFGKLIPNNIKNMILKRLLSVEEKDLFPLFLRCNSIFKINQTAQKVGLKKEFLKTYPNPSYFKFNKLLLVFIVYIERILAKLKFLDFTRMYFLLSYRKTK